jgi:DNA-directed RNA polymerase beta subunit
MNCRTDFLEVNYPLENSMVQIKVPIWFIVPSSRGPMGRKGDVLADNSSSQQGELAIGQNILVGYTEGYNFEDAVLISQRLIHNELYTSLHIER